MKEFNPKWIKIIAAILIIVILGGVWIFRAATNGAKVPGKDPVPGSQSITTTVDRGMSAEQMKTFTDKIGPLEAQIADNEANGKRDISLILQLANLYYETGDLQKSSDTYRDILRTNPTDPPALENLAQAQIEMGDFAGAKASLIKVSDLEAYEPTYLKLVDLIHAHFPEDDAKIQTILEAAIANLGQTPGLLTALGDWYASHDQLDEAISHYEVAHTLSPKDTSITETLTKLRAEKSNPKKK